MRILFLLALFITSTPTWAGNLNEILENAYKRLEKSPPTAEIHDPTLFMTENEAKASMYWIAKKATKNNTEILGRMASYIALKAQPSDVDWEDDKVHEAHSAWTNGIRVRTAVGSTVLYSLLYGLSIAPHFETVPGKILAFIVGAVPAAAVALVATGIRLQSGQNNFYSDLDRTLQGERAKRILAELPRPLLESATACAESLGG